MSDHTPSAHDLIAAYMDGRNDRPHQQEEARDRATRAIAKVKADAVREFLDDLDPSEMAPERVERWIKNMEEQR